MFVDKFFVDRFEITVRPAMEASSALLGGGDIC